MRTVNAKGITPDPIKPQAIVSHHSQAFEEPSNLCLLPLVLCPRLCFSSSTTQPTPKERHSLERGQSKTLPPCVKTRLLFKHHRHSATMMRTHRLCFTLMQAVSPHVLFFCNSIRTGRSNQLLLLATDLVSQTAGTMQEFECLVVVWAVKEFWPCLYDRRFAVVTNNIALHWLQRKTSKPSSPGGLSSC